MGSRPARSFPNAAYVGSSGTLTMHSLCVLQILPGGPCDKGQKSTVKPQDRLLSIDNVPVGASRCWQTKLALGIPSKNNRAAMLACKCAICTQAPQVMIDHDVLARERCCNGPHIVITVFCLSHGAGVANEGRRAEDPD